MTFKMRWATGTGSWRAGVARALWCTTNTGRMGHTTYLLKSCPPRAKSDGDRRCPDASKTQSTWPLEPGVALGANRADVTRVAKCEHICPIDKLYGTHIQKLGGP